MADFNIFDHLSRQGGGFGGGAAKAGPDDGTNEKDIVDGVIMGGADKSPGNVAKLSGIPVNLNDLGTTGIQKALGGDTEGIAGKMIVQGGVLSDAPGGFLAKLLHSIFIKNREITDHTQGVGGDGGNFADGGSGGGFSDGGGDFGGGSGNFAGGNGFSDNDFIAMGGNFGDFVSPSSFPDYPYTQVSAASLGEFSPPQVGDRGAAVSSGMDI